MSSVSRSGAKARAKAISVTLASALVEMPESAIASTIQAVKKDSELAYIEVVGPSGNLRGNNGGRGPAPMLIGQPPAGPSAPKGPPQAAQGSQTRKGTDKQPAVAARNQGNGGPNQGQPDGGNGGPLIAPVVVDSVPVGAGANARGAQPGGPARCKAPGWPKEVGLRLRLTFRNEIPGFKF